jgi:hypothetical protein
MFKVRFVLLFAFLMCIVACAPTDQTADSVSVETVRPTATAVAPTPALSAINQLINDFTAAGATVVNNGRTEQGLFPGDNIGLWHVSINEVDVNVFEFSDTATRQATGENISPRGDTFTVTDGDTAVTTHWDWIELPYFWAVDNLIVNYWGEDTAVVTLITNVLGQPFADGSQPYRPEAGSGSIAGIGEYGVSFQYDPYLAAGIPAEMTMGQESVGADDFIYEAMPEHITFTFLHSYLDDRTVYHQTVNIPDQPQILVFPLESYANMSDIAQGQIAQLEAMLVKRTDVVTGELPFLPPPNGQQMIQAQLSYLDFQNGSGLRYLTQYAQEARQINNEELFYTFQGITADHAYYVVAFFPVQSDSLPAKDDIADYEAFANNMPTYLVQTTADLNALPNTAFQPDLTLLDAVIQSLRVEPTVELTAPITAD